MINKTGTQQKRLLSLEHIFLRPSTLAEQDEKSEQIYQKNESLML